ncbi:SGNH/GDSL hydrolase family protein [Pseudarthrobacter sp. MDT1-22]
MALGFTAIPAEAAAPPQTDYVALGDSYAAGQGAAPYTDRTCFVSRKGYPVIADNLKGVQLTANAACSGYTIGAVASNLPASVAGAEVVTITVGGNDLDATGLLATCFAVPDACPGAAAVREAVLRDAIVNPSSNALVQGLAGLSQAVRAQASDARIVFTGYPMLFDPAFPDPRAGVVNQLTAGLNDVIRLSAMRSGAEYVDVATAFAGHGIGSAEPWINFNAANILAPANFHPNGEGYRHGYYASLVGKLTGQ